MLHGKESQGSTMKLVVEMTATTLRDKYTSATSNPRFDLCLVPTFIAEIASPLKKMVESLRRPTISLLLK
jgi:hypothetical protein